MKWLESVALKGVKIIEKDAPELKYRNKIITIDRELIKDPAAPRLWARFYDLKTGKQFFAKRSGERVETFAEVNRERRTGYSWHSYWPESLISKEFPAWQKAMQK